MALFQKKIIPISIPQYNIGSQKTKLIVGLGNIGPEYENTRHNLGFAALDDFAATEEFNGWIEKKDLKSILCAKIINGEKIILCKPTTYMNLSGEAIQAVQHFYKIKPNDICVIYDELDLSLGTIRTTLGGQTAGHNGLKSLKQHINDKFWRIRLGIGPKLPTQIDAADFVLARFSKDQQAKLPELYRETRNLLSEWLSGQAKPETRRLD